MTFTRAMALVLALSLAAPAPLVRAEVPLVDYVVEKGDTCVSVARKLYGSSKHVDRLHKHNDLGKQPHYLAPGTILRVERSDASSEPAGPDARLSFLRNVVESFTPEQAPGRLDEPLQRGHRVNTHADSSAEVTFTDGSRIQLGAQSLVVILGSTSTQANTSRSAEDTTLVRGSLRAHLGALAGKKPAPLALQTPSGQINVEPGEAQVEVDAEETTRLSVYKGNSEIRAKGKRVRVPQGFGSSAKKNAPPTPPRPLPVAPTWTTPPPVLVLQDKSVPLVGTFAPGSVAPDAPAAATWHVQVALDERFNDLKVDTRIPATVTQLSVEIPGGGTYFTRVSAIDADQFEGPTSQVTTTTIVRVEPVPSKPGTPAQLVVREGLFCAVDAAPLSEVRAPILLTPGQGKELRCALDVSGTGAVVYAIPPELVALPPPEVAPTPQPPPPTPIPPPRPREDRRLAIGGALLLEFGGLAAVAAIATGLRGQTLENRFESAACSIPQPSESCEDLLGRGRVLNIIMITSAVVAPLALGSGLALTLRARKRAPRTAFSPVLRSGTFGVRWQWSF